jgi:hypothetical protein
MQRHLLIGFVLAQLLAALLWAQPVQAVDTGFTSGSVFVDGNGNRQAEPQEARWTGATVHFRSQTDPAQVFTTQTDADGYFALTAPYDVYDVWASVNGQAGPQVLTAEVAEVGGQVQLDVPVNMLFLPLLTTAE